MIFQNLSVDDIVHSVEAGAVVLGCVAWIYDRLKKADSNEVAVERINSKIDKVDNKLSQAMVEMAENVNSLAVSVGKIEGRLEGVGHLLKGSSN